MSRDELRAAHAARSLILADLARSEERVGRAEAHVQGLEAELAGLLDRERERVARMADALLSDEAIAPATPGEHREAQYARLDVEERLSAARLALDRLTAEHAQLTEARTAADARVRAAAQAAATAEAQEMAQRCVEFLTEGYRLQRRLRAFDWAAGPPRPGSMTVSEPVVGALNYAPDNLFLETRGPTGPFWDANTEAWSAFVVSLQSDPDAELSLPDGDYGDFRPPAVVQQVIPMNLHEPRQEPSVFTRLPFLARAG